MQNNDQKPSEQLLSIGKAAKFIGVSIDTLRRWEKRGRIIPLRSPGGHRYFKRQDLEALFGIKYLRDEKETAGKNLEKDQKEEEIKSQKTYENIPTKYEGIQKPEVQEVKFEKKELIVPRFVSTTSFSKFEKLLTITPNPPNIPLQSILNPTVLPQTSASTNQTKKTLDLDIKTIVVIMLTLVTLVIAIFFLVSLVRGPQILSPVP